MRKNVLGDGVTTCLICGTKTGLLKESLRYCAKCGQVALSIDFFLAFLFVVNISLTKLAIMYIFPMPTLCPFRWFVQSAALRDVTFKKCLASVVIACCVMKKDRFVFFHVYLLSVNFL